MIDIREELSQLMFQGPRYARQQLASMVADHRIKAFVMREDGSVDITENNRQVFTIEMIMEPHIVRGDLV